MNAKLKAWLDRIDAMSLRERVLIFGMLAVAVIAVGFNLAIDPQTARAKLLDGQLAQQRAQITALQAQMQAMVEAVKNDPNAPNRARLADAQAQLAAARAQLAGTSQGFVAPRDMAPLLRDMLGKNPGLKLVSMQSIAPTPVMGGDSKAATTKPEQKTPGSVPALYKHGIEITVEASYPELLAYLNALERMPWRVYWGSARLAVAQYPVSRLTLTVFTLSVEKTWLAV